MAQYRPTFDPLHSYYIVGNHNPTTQVWKVDAGTYVVNTDTAFLAWLTARNNASSFDVIGAANNGSGLIRLQLNSTGLLQTGQKWNVFGVNGTVEADGNWTITVIDDTHIDLQGSTFLNPYFFDGFGVVQGAAVIDTEASMWAAIAALAAKNTKGFGYVPLDAQNVISGSDVLVNPMAKIVSRAFSASQSLTLPIMNVPNSLPIGQGVIIRNDGTNEFSVLDSASATVIAALPPGMEAVIFSESFGLLAGVLQYNIKSVKLGQYAFPATQNPSSNVNTLDDYKEGIFTPVFTASTVAPTGVTYSVQVGTYTKMGRMVFFDFQITLTSKGTLGVGNINITGLPYTLPGGAANKGIVTSFSNIALSAGYTYAQCNVANGTSQMVVGKYGDGLAQANLQWADATDTTVIRGNGSYPVS